MCNMKDNLHNSNKAQVEIDLCWSGTSEGSQEGERGGAIHSFDTRGLDIADRRFSDQGASQCLLHKGLLAEL